MAALDLITFEEAAGVLGIPASRHDEAITRLISTASQRIDELCGPVVIRTVTETHDGNTVIGLRESPVSSVTTVTDSGGTITGYTADLPAGLIFHPFTRGLRNVTVTYQAGRVATTGDVPAKFREACCVAVNHYWKTERATRTPTGDSFEFETPNRATYFMPRAALEILALEIREPMVG